MFSLPFDSKITGYDSSGIPIYDRASGSAEFARLLAAFLTNGVFGSGMFAVNLVDDYNNKKVNLAYNGKTGVLVVLGLADEPLVEPADTSEIE